MTANELEREVRAGGGLRAQGGSQTISDATPAPPSGFVADGTSARPGVRAWAGRDAKTTSY